MTGLDLSVSEELSSAFESCLNEIIRISINALRADKSAVGAINRPLPMAG